CATPSAMSSDPALPAKQESRSRACWLRLWRGLKKKKPPALTEKGHRTRRGGSASREAGGRVLQDLLPRFWGAPHGATAGGGWAVPRSAASRRVARSLAGVGRGTPAGASGSGSRVAVVPVPPLRLARRSRAPAALEGVRSVSIA